MKILYITHYSGLYGANRCLLTMIVEMKKKDINVLVLSPTEGEFTDNCKKIGIRCIISKFYFFLSETNSKFKNNLKKCLNYFLRYNCYKKINKEFVPDIIHSNSSLCDIGVYLSNKFKSKLVWHIREFGDVDYNLKYNCSLKKAELIYQKANRLIFISNNLKMNYEKEKFHTFNNSRVIYDGISFDYCVQQNKEYDKVIFLLCGFISKNKNQFEPIKAANELNHQGIKHFKIIIVGDGNKEYISEIRQYIKNNHLEENVEFVGFKKDIKPLLSSSHWGLMPSKREAFGRTTIEYNFAGLPDIAANTGSNPELIKEGINGFIYQFNNINDLVDKMKKAILMKKEDYLILSKSAKDYAVSKFSSTNNTEQIFECYKELLTKKGEKSI